MTRRKRPTKGEKKRKPHPYASLHTVALAYPCLLAEETATSVSVRAIPRAWQRSSAPLTPGTNELITDSAGQFGTSQ